MPIIEADKITIFVFYGAKRTLSVARLVGYSTDGILKHWQKYCRAYVVAEMSPYLTALDHNATRNAAFELKRPERWVRIPTLRELDSALNTSLEAVENRMGALLLRRDFVDVHDQRCR